MPRPALSRRAAAARTKSAASSSGQGRTELPLPEPVRSDPSSDIYGHSDREHERLRIAQQQQPARRTRSSGNGKELGGVGGAAGREAQEARRNQAMERLEAEKAATSSSKARGRTLEKSDASIEMGRRQGGTPSRARDTTGFDLDDSTMFGGLDSSFQFGSSAVKPAAGHSTDTSTLSVGRFKRRSRAPSISGRGDDRPIRPSSRGPNTPGLSSNINIGLFKRRPREPSIIGTARKAMSSRAGSEAPSSEPARSELGAGEGETGGTEAEDESAGEDPAAPEAGSTPPGRRRSRRQASPRPAADEPQRRTSERTSRKRKSSEGPAATRDDDAEDSDISASRAGVGTVATLAAMGDGGWAATRPAGPRGGRRRHHGAASEQRQRGGTMQSCSRTYATWPSGGDGTRP